MMWMVRSKLRYSTTPSWTLKVPSSSEQAYDWTYMDPLHIIVSCSPGQSEILASIKFLYFWKLKQYFRKRCHVHAWNIDSQYYNDCVVVVKWEVPFIWHPYAVFSCFLHACNISHHLFGFYFLKKNFTKNLHYWVPCHLQDNKFGSNKFFNILP